MFLRRGFLITNHYESILCLDLIAACAGLVSHIQAAAYKETDRGIYIVLFFLSTTHVWTVTDMNRLFMLEKKNRNQNLREARCQIIRFLLMSNVIAFFVFASSSFLFISSSVLSYFVSFIVAITRLLCHLNF